ncbi:MAG: HAMP domain-containing histidine kinase [Bdellovibrionales bacterium]|nr:HAMP domain-containing histidine kinase [Bdellovibrionales bacterium]
MENDVSVAKSKGSAWRFGLGLAWMVFTLSLAAWWLIFGLRQIDFVQTTTAQFAPEHAVHVADFVRQQRMLISEGSILILSLLVGGGALLYYMRRERKRADQIRAFFATFSHELKTPIASLRLQVESLAEDFRDSPSNPLFVRLVKDSVRLEIQLENSLHLAQLDSSRFFLERIDLRRMVEALAHQWPDTRLEVEGDAPVRADHRALETVVKNLIQNAIIHGGAKRVRFFLANGGGRVSLRVSDDGAGFTGDAAQLGRLFVRHNPKSGSGVGLFLVRSLVERMGGSVRFVARSAAEGSAAQGFDVEIELLAERKGAAA